MNGRKERGIRRRYERIEGIVTQIFSSTRKLVTIYWELIRVRGGSYTEYVTRESEAKEKLALSSNDVRRERYHHHLLDLVVVVDFSWCRKSRGRASISGSLSIPLSLFFHFFPSSSLLVYNSTKHTFILLLFKCLTSLQLFTSRPRWKNFARKIWRNVGFRTEKSKKNEKLFGWWVSGIRTLDYFGGKLGL